MQINSAVTSIPISPAQRESSQPEPAQQARVEQANTAERVASPQEQPRDVTVEVSQQAQQAERNVESPQDTQQVRNDNVYSRPEASTPERTLESSGEEPDRASQDIQAQSTLEAGIASTNSSGNENLQIERGTDPVQQALSLYRENQQDGNPERSALAGVDIFI